MNKRTPDTSAEDLVSCKWGRFTRDRFDGNHPRMLFWLDHPTVRKYIYNTYLDGVSPLEYAMRHFVNRPFEHGLEVGCGPGELAIKMIRHGICRNIDAIDLSSEAIEVARKKADECGIKTAHFSVADANKTILAKDKYDFACFSQSLHHVEKIEHLFTQLDGALKSDGVIFISDYIGPARLQWPDKYLRIMNMLHAMLPDKLKISSILGNTERKSIANVPLDTYEECDPSEAVRSDEILPLIDRYFNIIDRRAYGGTLLGELLLGCIHNYDPSNAEDNSLLRLLCQIEYILISENIISPSFACIIARKRSLGTPN